MSPDDLAAVRQALLDHHVVFLPGQSSDPEALLGFGKEWGEIRSDHPAYLDVHDEYSDICVVTNTGDFNAADTWHADMTYVEQPPKAAVLHALEVPEIGGDTIWTNMVAVYASLSDELQQRLDGLFAIHDFTHNFGRGMNPDRLSAMQKKFPPARHPVVRTHPETGEKALYVNGAFTSEIEGMDANESDSLLEKLYRRAQVPEFQVRFAWRENSIAFWDNRTTQHYPISDYWPQSRRMERVTVVGDAPF